MTIQITDHAGEARARLTQALKGKPNLTALLDALNVEIQALENAFWQLHTERLISTAVGAQLDVIGRIIGQERGSATDSEYRILLSGRVLANKSNGTTPEILNLFRVLLGVNPRFEDSFPAGFVLHVDEIALDPDFIEIYADFLGDAKAAGVKGILHWYQGEGEETFACGALTQLDGAFNEPFPTSVSVDSTEGFPSNGQFAVEDGSSYRVFSYTHKTETSFEGVASVSGTGSSFADDSFVMEYNEDQGFGDANDPDLGGGLSGALDG